MIRICQNMRCPGSKQYYENIKKCPYCKKKMIAVKAEWQLHIEPVIWSKSDDPNSWRSTETIKLPLRLVRLPEIGRAFKWLCYYLIKRKEQSKIKRKSHGEEKS